MFTNDPQRSSSLPLVPLTAGSFLIPFEPSVPSKGMIRNALPRTDPRKFYNIQQQIQERGKILADLQRQNSDQVSSLSKKSQGTPTSPAPVFSSNSRRPLPPFPPRITLPSATTTLPTPYASGNLLGTSSSSSSSSSNSSGKSSASAIPLQSAGQASSTTSSYAQPFSNNSSSQQLPSRPSVSYQQLGP